MGGGWEKKSVPACKLSAIIFQNIFKPYFENNCICFPALDKHLTREKNMHVDLQWEQAKWLPDWTDYHRKRAEKQRRLRPNRFSSASLPYWLYTSSPFPCLISSHLHKKQNKITQRASNHNEANLPASRWLDVYSPMCAWLWPQHVTHCFWQQPPLIFFIFFLIVFSKVN